MALASYEGRLTDLHNFSSEEEHGTKWRGQEQGRNEAGDGPSLANGSERLVADYSLAAFRQCCCMSHASRECRMRLECLSKGILIIISYV